MNSGLIGQQTTSSEAMARILELGSCVHCAQRRSSKSEWVSAPTDLQVHCRRACCGSHAVVPRPMNSCASRIKLTKPALPRTATLHAQLPLSAKPYTLSPAQSKTSVRYEAFPEKGQQRAADRAKSHMRQCLSTGPGNMFRSISVSTEFSIFLSSAVGGDC